MTEKVRTDNNFHERKIVCIRAQKRQHDQTVERFSWVKRDSTQRQRAQCGGLIDHCLRLRNSPTACSEPKANFVYHRHLPPPPRNVPTMQKSAGERKEETIRRSDSKSRTQLTTSGMNSLKLTWMPTKKGVGEQSTSRTLLGSTGM